MESESNKKYAYLPEDLILKMLEQAPETARKVSELVNIDEEVVGKAREILTSNGIIMSNDSKEYTDSLIAVDGAQIVEKKTSSDILLSLAAGVEGLKEKESTTWPPGGHQYFQWQAVLPHHAANPTLSQGIMFLMELSVLARADQEIRILDGTHLTMIIKLNSLLSAYDDEFADESYVHALAAFLKEKYEKVIPDIPDIIKDAFSDPCIIGMAKYSSSREIVDSLLKDLKILMDDKIFLTFVLKGDEFTKPLSVGRGIKEKEDWKRIHIGFNLPIFKDLGPEQESKMTFELKRRLEEAIHPFKVSGGVESSLYFTFYRPFEDGPVYRIEIKKELASDLNRLKKVLNSIKHQIVFPEIREPYPQYLADVIAKNISFGMNAVEQAICNDPTISNSKNFDLIFPYRTN
jgi:hypothetical protein